jgi:hypothetical protein
LGRVVATQKVNFERIDLSKYPSGILFIKIETNEASIIKKVLKE